MLDQTEFPIRLGTCHEQHIESKFSETLLPPPTTTNSDQRIWLFHTQLTEAADDSESDSNSLLPR